jgi:hypothetical protein
MRMPEPNVISKKRHSGWASIQQALDISVRHRDQAHSSDGRAGTQQSLARPIGNEIILKPSLGD